MFKSYKEDLSPYKYVRESISRYWKIYGGWHALLCSPYFHLSIIISLICYPIWSTDHEGWAWFNLCISVMPNLIGFTLGGYAMLLAFGNEKFRSLLAGSDDSGDASPFMKVNATFIHFILMQILSLLIALIELAWSIKVGVFAFIGFTIFLYALLTGIAAAFAILRLAGWFDDFIKIQNNDDEKNN
jgi:hypothetical protein